MFGLGPGVGGLGAGRRGRGRGYNRQPYAVILALQLVQQIANLRRKPPLTLALMAGMTVLHLKPDLFEDLVGGTAAEGTFGWSSSWFGGGTDLVRSFCLLPASMLDAYVRHGTLEIHRLLVSAFIHGDDMHLYYNMASFLLKGVSLELTMGSQAYGGLLVFSLVVSQTLLLLCSWLLMTVFDAPEAMYACTVGFSGVLFALKYVLNRRSPGSSTVMGFRLNTRYAAWLELVLISILVPNASFLGHLCGILAGILYVEVPNVLGVLGLLSGFTLFNAAPSYTYRSGTAGGTPTNNASPPSHNVDDASAAEEMEFQEALRRSMQDTGGARGGGGGGGGASAGGPSRSPREGLRRDVPSVDTRPVAPSPSAPPEEDISSVGVNRGGDMDANELRRRRLQRLGVHSVDL